MCIVTSKWTELAHQFNWSDQNHSYVINMSVHDWGLKISLQWGIEERQLGTCVQEHVYDEKQTMYSGYIRQNNCRNTRHMWNALETEHYHVSPYASLTPSLYKLFPWGPKTSWKRHSGTDAEPLHATITQELSSLALFSYASQQLRIAHYGCAHLFPALLSNHFFSAFHTFSMSLYGFHFIWKLKKPSRNKKKRIFVWAHAFLGPNVSQGALALNSHCVYNWERREVCSRPELAPLLSP